MSNCVFTMHLPLHSPCLRCSHTMPKSSWCHAGFELASVATAAGTKDKNHTSLLCHALREVAQVCPDISQLPTQLLFVSKAADLMVCCSRHLPNSLVLSNVCNGIAQNMHIQKSSAIYSWFCLHKRRSCWSE